jgi:CheY-like chemotaxis protein/anti-sigma regulatory factor (Ser/Thr protein kinase)
MCDPTRLSQVLSNLLSNAVKFTKNGQIELIAKKVSGDDLKVTLSFTVRDNGIGIPDSKQKMVFEAFTQAASSTTRKYGGTGLGLSITRRLLELQGSQIHLQSSEGRGSAFSFDLIFDVPSDTHDSNVPIKINLPEGDLLAGKRVLLVEDNPMNILVASEFLKRWKVNVTVAENGLEAIEKYDNHDLVLMDLQMPEMDGYTATLELRKRHISTPIIALTASALIDVRRKIMESGMDDLVVKPFNPIDLYNKLVEYIKPEKTQ